MSGATKIDDGSMDAYLTCHFNIARMLSMRKGSVQEKVRDWSRRCVVHGVSWARLCVGLTPRLRSLARYKWLICVAPTLRTEENTDLFATELEIAKQMVELLPPKIDRLHYTGRDVSM